MHDDSFAATIGRLLAPETLSHEDAAAATKPVRDAVNATLVREYQRVVAFGHEYDAFLKNEEDRVQPEVAGQAYGMLILAVNMARLLAEVYERADGDEETLALASEYRAQAHEHCGRAERWAYQMAKIGLAELDRLAKEGARD